MKLSIPADDLAKAAGVIARVASERDRERVPILACARLTAARDALHLYGTDLGIGVFDSTGCEVSKPGEVAVNAKLLAKFAGTLNGTVVLHTTSTGLTIACGRSRLTLPTSPIEDGPAPLAVEGNGPPIEIGSANLMALFAHTAIAVASNDHRPYLAGPTLFSEPTGDRHRLCAVGTNGNTMLLYAATNAACSDLGRGMIIHRDVCNLAVHLFGKTGATLRFDGCRIELALDNKRLVAKRVDAAPAEWRCSAPPAEVENFAVFETKVLRAALERCLAITSEGDLSKRAPAATMQWHSAKVLDEVSVSLGAGSVPTATDHVPVTELAGQLTTSVDPRQGGNF
jgi:DNA polymerase III sliding clamp (beta) subunit (PCNA family)